MAEGGVNILAAIEDPDDLNIVADHTERYGGAALKAQDPQARRQVIAPRAAFGKGGQGPARLLNPVDIAPRHSRAGFLCDIVEEVEEIVQSRWTESDLSRHA